MTQDIRQWLAEIKSLQQKLTEAQQERDDALKSAANWRNLYETEARQRRTEAKLAQQKIDSLQMELNGLKGSPMGREAGNLRESDPTCDQDIQQQVSQLDTTEALQNRLSEVLLEQEQLKQALRSEQAAHQQTRVELTAALGDAIDLLTQERDRSQTHGKPAAPPEKPVVPPPSKNPSLELPQFE